MKRKHPAQGGVGNDSQVGDSRDHSTTGAITKTSRPRVGDIVSVPGVGRCHVIADTDPSLLTVQNAQGVEFKVGERAVQRLDGGAR